MDDDRYSNRTIERTWGKFSIELLLLFMMDGWMVNDIEVTIINK